MARFVFVVRFRQRNGRNDGYGPTKAFKTTASSSKNATKKMKQRGEILSVRKLKPASRR